MLMVVLFPRIIVAFVARTLKACFGQLLIELGDLGFSACSSLATFAADLIDHIEEVVLNATATAAPQLAGSSLIMVASFLAGSGASLPALPP